MRDQLYKDLKCIMKGQHDYKFYKEFKQVIKENGYGEYYIARECITCEYITEPIKTGKWTFTDRRHS